MRSLLLAALALAASVAPPASADAACVEGTTHRSCEAHVAVHVTGRLAVTDEGAATQGAARVCLHAPEPAGDCPGAPGLGNATVSWNALADRSGVSAGISRAACLADACLP